jgi:hypothetical protein
MLAAASMEETQRFDVAERVAISKARLSEKLSELARRVESAKQKADPEKIARKPWVIGLAGVAGFLIGMALRGPRTPRVAGPAAPPGILRTLVREVLVAAAGSYTRKYLGTGDALHRKT